MPTIKHNRFYKSCLKCDYIERADERTSERASKQLHCKKQTETEIENKTRVKMTYIDKLNNKTLCTKPRSNHASTLSINVSIAYHSLDRKTLCIPGVNIFVSDFLMYLPKTTNRAHEQTSFEIETSQQNIRDKRKNNIRKLYETGKRYSSWEKEWEKESKNTSAEKIKMMCLEFKQMEELKQTKSYCYSEPNRTETKRRSAKNRRTWKITRWYRWCRHFISIRYFKT